MEVRIIKLSDVTHCPKRILAVTHYREDGTCWCHEDAPAD
jgi:hypothetical protein